MAQIRAALLDKDGTIVDFHKTWDTAIGRALRVAAPDATALGAAAALLDYDLETNTVGARSPVIAEPNEVVVALIEPWVDVELFVSATEAACVELVAPASGLPAALHELRDFEVELAIVTNDWESIVVNQLEHLGWRDLFTHVLASDSGYGAKPDATIVQAALDRMGVHPGEAMMVGDTAHDMVAGRSGGVLTVLVTNGLRPDPEAAAHADLVVSRMGELVRTLVRAGRL